LFALRLSPKHTCPKGQYHGVRHFKMMEDAPVSRRSEIASAGQMAAEKELVGQ